MLVEREDIAVAFVPINTRAETSLAELFLPALTARLAYLHGFAEPLPSPKEVDEAHWRRLMADYVSLPRPYRVVLQQPKAGR
jgi:hypothetical protein